VRVKCQTHSECVVRVKCFSKPSDVNVRACGKRTANALCALTRIAVGGMTAPRESAKMTRVKRKDNAKITLNNAKNNARITLNNANACESRAESGVAYVLYLRELRLEIGPGAGFF
jgi:hypothetical protein